MPGFTIDVGQVIQSCDELTRPMADMRPAFEKAAALMRKSFAANFQQGGRPDPWAPLSPNTVYSKAGNFGGAITSKSFKARRLTQFKGGRQRGGFNKILVSRGDLRDSYVQKGKKGNICKVTQEGFEAGSQHWLARWHEEGTDPYVIRPKNKGMLAFTVVGGFVMTKLVHHPGLPSRPVAIVQPEDEDAITELVLAHLAGVP